MTKTTLFDKIVWSVIGLGVAGIIGSGAIKDKDTSDDIFKYSVGVTAAAVVAKEFREEMRYRRQR